MTGISLAITVLALAFSATVSILQMRHRIELEESRSADSVALGVARAAELAMNVQDTKELSRLANSFLAQSRNSVHRGLRNKPDPAGRRRSRPPGVGCVQGRHAESDAQRALGALD